MERLGRLLARGESGYGSPRICCIVTDFTQPARVFSTGVAAQGNLDGETISEGKKAPEENRSIKTPWVLKLNPLTRQLADKVGSLVTTQYTSDVFERNVIPKAFAVVQDDGNRCEAALAEDAEPQPDPDGHWSSSFEAQSIDHAKCLHARVLAFRRMSTCTMWDREGEPCIEKHTDSLPMEESANLQTNKNPEGTLDGDHKLFVRRGSNLCPPTRTHKDDLGGLEMDRSEAGFEAAVCQTGNMHPDDDGKYRKIMEVVADPYVLIAAYERIKSDIGKTGIHGNWFESTAEQLLAGTYSFKSLRNDSIPKPGEARDTRHSLVISPGDQIVQEAVRAVIARIYESTDGEDPEGLGAGTSCHSALRTIKSTWKGINWFVQFEIQKSDHTLVQKRLIGLLSRKIADQRILDLLVQMFDAGKLSVGRPPNDEIAQGSVLAPLLGDIYFQQLDEEIDRIKREFDRN